MLVRDDKHFFLYLPILNKSMQKIKNGLLIAILLFSFSAQSQCDYTLDNYKHIDCYGYNTGVIDVTISPNASYWWTGAGSFNSTSSSLNNLLAGDYVLHIMHNLIPGDTSSSLICYIVDTLTIKQTLQITASFELSSMCNEYDSTDVKTTILGGTPPYTTLWSTGDTARNTDSLAPSILPYTLTITDTNNCFRNQFLIVNSVQEMNPFMSAVGVICKDDYSGSARVFITEGTPPFQFQWSTDSSIIIEHHSFSVIESLRPGEYRVKITDDMGCITRDTIHVKSNPTICITVYKVFSPNDDAIHEFWEIENIHLYPEALVQVYNRTGKQVYRRRNYINAEEHAFGGKDQEGRTLPSGTYYYIIDLENEDTVFKGALTIVR
ncbi:MAG TPA: gliding motility-associated C-terminal domain-containing protein [Flavobacteriales bacterium]|nr:gliding motility-associated C-terminal domain-containing protein [Flavobacteriales bacterium]